MTYTPKIDNLVAARERFQVLEVFEAKKGRDKILRVIGVRGFEEA